MLQRGTTSTRWRDLLDAAVLSDRFQFAAADVREAATQVAAHRGAELGPLRALMDGYCATGQAKWAAWRRKLKVEDLCEQNLDAQVERVLTFIEPVFDGSAEDRPHSIDSRTFRSESYGAVDGTGSAPSSSFRGGFAPCREQVIAAARLA